jgi:hypothetical protein
MGVFFLATGVLIAVIGFGASPLRSKAGAALALFATLGHPLIVGTSGLPWDAGGLMGTAPDPTALAALGVALGTCGWRRWAIALPAGAWCVFGFLTALGMERPALGAAAGAGAALFCVFSVWPGRKRGLG